MPHYKKQEYVYISYQVQLYQVNIKGATCLTALHGVVVLLSLLLPYSLSVCEQAEKLEVLDYALSVTSMSASIGQ